MANPDPKQITYDFKYNETHSYHVFPARDIPLEAESNPGIYAWYIRVLGSATVSNDLEFYSNVFAARQLDIKAFAPLSEEYTGTLKRKSAFGEKPANFTNMIATASTIFAPPIYIGISNNVKTRLQAHLRALNTALASPFVAASNSADAIASPTDSDDESAKFGQRIGRILCDQNITDVNCLFVKVIYQSPPNNIERQHTENFVNRIFTPICGRR